jgi:ABC-type uncharacterized transport system auxiliary subunit
MQKIAVIYLAVAMMTGCASVPESSLYTLDMQSSREAEPRFGFVDVRLRPSNAVGRPEIVIKPSPTRLEYYALHKWAGDLGALVNEKVQSELGQNPDSPYRAAVSGTILAFEQVDTAAGADVHIKLDVELQAGRTLKPGRATARRMYEVTLPAADATPAAVVEALSRGVEKIAGEIEQDLIVLTNRVDL